MIGWEVAPYRHHCGVHHGLLMATASSAWPTSAQPFVSPSYVSSQARRLSAIPLAFHQKPTAIDLDDATAGAVRRAMLGAGAAEPRALLVALGGQLKTLRSTEAPALRADDDTCLALRSVQLYAPLAQAVGFASLGMSIEALSYRRLFPRAMGRLAAWYEQVRQHTYGLVIPEPLHGQRKCEPCVYLHVAFSRPMTLKSTPPIPLARRCGPMRRNSSRS